MYIAYPLAISWYVAEKILAKHRITIDDIEASVRSPAQYVRKGRGNDIYEILSRSLDGVLVVLRKLSGARYRLITARSMTDSERRYYAKHRR